MEPESAPHGERDSRAQVPSDYRLEEERARELIRACYEEGILPTDIDPGEMQVSGREVRFILNTTLDEIKIKWLKERTVTIIFREGARFLPKKVKEDMVRAYEEVWIQEETFGQEFKRGRIKVESPNVVSYVPRAQAITDWMLRKKSDYIDLAGTIYRTEFKPWLTRAEIRDWRQLINQDIFWVVAVGVPLDEMPFLHVRVEKVIGKVTKLHKPEADEADPKLVNLRFDIDPASRGNMKDKIMVQTCQGDVLEVKLANDDSDWCKRCRTFFHTEATCRRSDRRNQGGSRTNQPQASATSRPAAPGAGYDGSPRAPSTSVAPLPSGSQQAAADSSRPGGATTRLNPTFSPGVNQNGFHRYETVAGGQSQERQPASPAVSVSRSPAPSGFHVRGESPGKQRRVSEGDVEIRVDELHAESSASSEGSQKLPSSVKGKRKPSHSRMDALTKGQTVVESRLVPMMLTAARNSFWAIAWTWSAGSPMFLNAPCPESPMPLATETLTKTIFQNKFPFRLIETSIPRFLIDMEGKRVHLYTPLFDARLSPPLLDSLEKEGLILFPLQWLGEGWKSDLRRIKLSLVVTSEVLSELNAKLGKDRKLDSLFIRKALTDVWPTSFPVTDANSQIQLLGAMALDGQA
ncbi:hypothetical protein CBR_g35039 [Chara braunii]|uniref:Uncharacterized protein n=1 Tax=Chara braunii TaxID=69332 RepID=A0A388LK10_CHABU|nr:hypothetical protein CBR_g35039 [Chara braunii]|eukprot:GBG82674.1 hypothetical protein CBR_g35039 [Chara braunii]